MACVHEGHEHDRDSPTECVICGECVTCPAAHTCIVLTKEPR